MTRDLRVKKEEIKIETSFKKNKKKNDYKVIEREEEKTPVIETEIDIAEFLKEEE